MNIKKLFYQMPMTILSRLVLRFEKRFRQFKGIVALEKIENKGQGCLIQGDVSIYFPDKVVLGSYVRIGYGAFFYGIGGISIGDNTQISRNVTIYSGNHNIEGLTIPYDDTYILKSVEIGHSVWIGMNVCITPGVKIGNGAVIGMGTVVSKDVPDGAVVVGAGQKIVKYRNMDDFNKKKNEKKYYGEYY